LTRTLAAIAAMLACVFVVACGDDDNDGDDGNTRTSAQVRLSIEARDGRGAVERAELVCAVGEVTSSGLPDTVRDPCRTARRLAPFLAEQPPADRVCTQIFGGPQTARIKGEIDGRRVDRRFSRSDGCRVADWDRAQPLIPLRPVRGTGPR
jgi:hypothetical protein